MFPVRIPLTLKLKRLFTRKSHGDRNVSNRDNSGQITIDQSTNYQIIQQTGPDSRTEEEKVKSRARHLLKAADYNCNKIITRFVADELMRYISAGPIPFGSKDPSEFEKWDKALEWLFREGMVEQICANRSGTHFEVTEAGKTFRDI